MIKLYFHFINKLRFSGRPFVESFFIETDDTTYILNILASHVVFLDITENVVQTENSNNCWLESFVQGGSDLLR